MNEAADLFYELRLKTEFLESKGTAFQDLFVRIMSKAHPGDFIPCRPWGAAGDRKNDGYLKSERLLFQIYAPNELKVAQTIAKVTEDFTEALLHWKDHFDTWVFVHNTTRGLPADVIAALLDLQQRHPAVKVTHWGFDELLLRFRQLPPEALRSLYGLAPQPGAPARTLRDSLTIIVPVYNEAANLEPLFKGLRAERFIDRYPILICDDASTDNSFALLQDNCKDTPSITCLHSPTRTHKVGAIEQMMHEVRTPFVLTLDADCMIRELHDDALEQLLRKMNEHNYAAACFRIIPHDRDWLGRLQKLDYTIFTDTIRRLLSIPVCLIGQGVVWNTEKFREVLSEHSKQYDGDDLENTLIALTKNMSLHWERDTLVLTTNPKESMLGVVRQRALSWDFGMFRVLLSKRAFMLGGNSGAFYKNIVLMDLVAHPLRLLAIPLLLGIVSFGLTGDRVFGRAAFIMYKQSLALSFDYGSSAIVGIWIATVVTSCICVRGRVVATVKWAIFNALYLSSPFVFVMYYPLVTATNVNAEDVFGSAVHWFTLGHFLTYVWWVLLTLILLCGSSLQRSTKRKLLASVLLAPMYYFILMVVCKTTGICKAFKERAFGR
ncbi:MAG TPA: glycosyltransferase family 2 protein [Bryobacteraceae bacterium]